MDIDLLAGQPTIHEEERGKPLLSINHAIVAMRLCVELLSKREEFDILPSVTLELAPAKRLVPDISVCPRVPLDLHGDVECLTEPPLLIVEILSFNQPLDEILEDMEFYLAHGVKSVWLVIPALRDVTIFLPDGSQQSFHSGTVRGPATGITADLDVVFS